MVPSSSCHVVLDCEFTDLDDPQLLSVGMVAEDGARLYIELDLSSAEGRARAVRASAFAQDQVLEFFGQDSRAKVATLQELGERAQAWLRDLKGRHIELLYDYAADYSLLESVLVTLPQWRELKDRLQPRNIAQECDCVDAELASEGCFEALKREGLYRHHALADALALQAAYYAVSQGAP